MAGGWERPSRSLGEWVYDLYWLHLKISDLIPVLCLDLMFFGSFPLQSRRVYCVCVSACLSVFGSCSADSQGPFCKVMCAVRQSFKRRKAGHGIWMRLDAGHSITMETRGPHGKDTSVPPGCPSLTAPSSGATVARCQGIFSY